MNEAALKDGIDMIEKARRSQLVSLSGQKVIYSPMVGDDEMVIVVGKNIWEELQKLASKA